MPTPAWLSGLDVLLAPLNPNKQVIEIESNNIVSSNLNDVGVSNDVAAVERAINEVELEAQQDQEGIKEAESILRPFYDDLSTRSVESQPVLKYVLKSEIPGVTDEQWTRFAITMKTASSNNISASNALGAWEIRPRRLADLGIMKNISTTRSPSGRMVWIGEFVKPLTQKKFLADIKKQYQVFADSMKKYVVMVRSGEIKKPETWDPKGPTTASGILAILHRAGPSGLENWCDETKRFPDTVALVGKVNGIF